MTKTRNRSGGLAPLTRERIVAPRCARSPRTASPAFTTRKLGQRLGCEAMSIYHHYPSKQHLLDALVEHAIGTVEVRSRGALTVAQVRASMHRYRGDGASLPALFPLVAVHRLNTPSRGALHRSVLG